MLSFRSPSNHERILAMAMRQIEKMLKDMQSEGKDLSRLKLKKFQKTHHIDCKCKLCEEAKKIALQHFKINNFAETEAFLTKFYEQGIT